MALSNLDVTEWERYEDFKILLQPSALETLPNGFFEAPLRNGYFPRSACALIRRFLLSFGVGSGVVILVFLLLRSHFAAPPPPEVAAALGRKRLNLIFMISDGFGPAGATLGRHTYNCAVSSNVDPECTNLAGTRCCSASGTYAKGSVSDILRSKREQLALESIMNISETRPAASGLALDLLISGTVKTHSASSLVTDSAAGATAYSCALKTFNGAIAVTPKNQPCATFFEAMSVGGWKTGLIVKSRITHATPASFNSHSSWREFEDAIAVHQIGDYPLGRVTDVMFGGGIEHFIPRLNGSDVGRIDGRNLTREAESRFGFQVIRTRDELQSGPLRMPLLGIFGVSHLPYEIDRDRKSTPSLLEMTRRGLDLLNSASHLDLNSKGFVAMIEGSRIDMAAHNNDPATQALEIIEYQAVVQSVVEFINQHKSDENEFILISTSDHETGGMTLAKQTSTEYPVYEWFPDVLLNQTTSIEVLSKRLAKKNNTLEELVNVVESKLGLLNLTNAERHHLNRTFKNEEDVMQILGSIVSDRARIGWTTHGHSGVDVNLYTLCTNSKCPQGNFDNTEIGNYIVQTFGLDESLKNLTAFLQQNLEIKPTREQASLKVPDNFQHD